MVVKIQDLLIIFAIFGGFLFTVFTKSIVGIAIMCLGIWWTQITQ